MIQPRREGEFRYGDIAIWSATGQEVTVLDDYDKHLVKVVDRGVVKHVPRRHLKLKVNAEVALYMFDDWLEERYGEAETDQL